MTYRNESARVEIDVCSPVLLVLLILDSSNVVVPAMCIVVAATWMANPFGQRKNLRKRDGDSDSEDSTTYYYASNHSAASCCRTGGSGCSGCTCCSRDGFGKQLAGCRVPGDNRYLVADELVGVDRGLAWHVEVQTANRSPAAGRTAVIAGWGIGFRRRIGFACDGDGTVLVCAQGAIASR